MKCWLGAACLLVACGIPKGAKDTLVFGHGGMGPDHEWPMDSREAVEACLASGADGVEIDLHLTADSVLIAYHDEDLSTATSCTGRVNAWKWEELQDCQYPQLHLEASDGSSFWPTPDLLALDTLFMRGAASGSAAFTFDCKLFSAGEWDAYLNAYVNALRQLVERYRLQGRVNIECMDANFLDRVKAAVPGVATFYYAKQAEEGIATAIGRFTGITIDRSRIDVGQVQVAHDVGLKIAVFGASGSRSHRQALALGADMIQTDDPQGLLDLLERSGK